MKKTIIILGILIIITIGALVYLELSSLKTDKDLEEVVDETADWQTYRNEELGFEIKIPGEWIITNNNISYVEYRYNFFPAENILADLEIRNKPGSFSSSCGAAGPQPTDTPGVVAINIYIYKNDENYHNLNEIRYDIANYYDFYDESGQPYIKTEYFYGLGESKAIEVNNTEGDDGYSLLLIAVNNDKAYNIGITSYCGEYENIEIIYKIYKILSTFKFID